MSFSLEEGKNLIELARNAINSSFSKKNFSIPSDKKFRDKLGVFVTLTKQGQLRGCIGFPEPVYALDRAVIEAARAAAFKDPRFEPVEEEEIEDMEIEISVLTMPEKIEVEEPSEYLDKIEIGKHGLIIRHAYSSGLLLPQVFSEHNCTPKEALDMVCEKAGLYKEAWQDSEAQLFSFEAQIFSEEEPKGKVIEKN